MQKAAVNKEILNKQSRTAFGLQVYSRMFLILFETKIIFLFKTHYLHVHIDFTCVKFIGDT
jgi:hypothetical protein